MPFDGWSPETFAEASKDSGVDPDTAKQMCPRGAVDLAVAFHELGDAQMVADMADADLADHALSRQGRPCDLAAARGD